MQKLMLNSDGSHITINRFDSMCNYKT